MVLRTTVGFIRDGQMMSFYSNIIFYICYHVFCSFYVGCGSLAALLMESSGL
jgi:hypothetical protein